MLNLIDISDDDDLLQDMLTGRVVSVTRDEELVVLTFHDGRRVALLVESFGLVMEDAGEC